MFSESETLYLNCDDTKNINLRHRVSLKDRVIDFNDSVPLFGIDVLPEL